MDLSISIVSWNVKEYLKGCLKSIYDTVNNISFEIIVVDNNSIDGTTQMIKNEFPSVKLIENKINYGYASANNQAIKQAKGNYLLILNPDTIILPQTIEGTADFMNLHPEAGIAACKKIDRHGNQEDSEFFMNQLDLFLSYKFSIFLKGAILLNCLSELFPHSKIIKKQLFNTSITAYGLNPPDQNNPTKVNVIFGSFMMVRKKLIEQIGGFDERFFHEFEDVDFCYRARNAGWKICFCPKYKIVHLGQRSANQLSKKDRENIRTHSQLTFYSKYWGKKLLCLKVFEMIIGRIVAKAVFLIFDFIFMLTGDKNRERYWDFGTIHLSSVSASIRNLFIIIFNINPQFNP